MSALTDVRQMVHEQYQYRELLYQMTKRDLLLRYKQSVMGFGWAIFMPVINTIVFTLVFQRAVQFNTGMPYPLFAFTGLLVWNFFASSLKFSAISLTSNTNLVTKVYFPREILPFTYLVAAVFDFAMGLVVLGALMAWYDVPITAQSATAIPLLALLCAWALAVTLVLASVQVRFRDIGVALPVLVQLWMFASPVIYPLSVVPEGWRSWYLLNPMAGIVTASRDILLRGGTPDAGPIVVATVVTAVALPAAYLFFKRAEATMADVI